MSIFRVPEVIFLTKVYLTTLAGWEGQYFSEDTTQSSLIKFNFTIPALKNAQGNMLKKVT